MAILDDCKRALRVTSNAYDTEIARLLNASVRDLEIAGVTASLQTTDDAVAQAMITYVLCHFGSVEPKYYDKLKASYDEQKGQLQTDFGDDV